MNTYLFFLMIMATTKSWETFNRETKALVFGTDDLDKPTPADAVCIFNNLTYGQRLKVYDRAFSIRGE